MIFPHSQRWSLLISTTPLVSKGGLMLQLSSHLMTSTWSGEPPLRWRQAGCWSGGRSKNVHLLFSRRRVPSTFNVNGLPGHGACAALWKLNTYVISTLRGTGPHSEYSMPFLTFSLVLTATAVKSRHLSLLALVHRGPPSMLGCSPVGSQCS